MSEDAGKRTHSVDGGMKAKPGFSGGIPLLYSI
jgi:hypothetical protein